MPSTKKAPSSKLGPWLKANKAQIKVSDRVVQTEDGNISSVFDEVFSTDDPTEKQFDTHLSSIIATASEQLSKSESIKPFVDLCIKRFRLLHPGYEKRIQTGILQATDFPIYFMVGSPVIVSRYGTKIGGVVASMQERESFMGRFLYIRVRTHIFAKTLSTAILTVSIPLGYNRYHLNQLPLALMTEDDKATLTKRGKALNETPTLQLVQHKGPLFQHDGWSLRTVPSNSRVLVDPVGFEIAESDSDSYSSLTNAFGIESPEDEDPIAVTQLSKEHLWQHLPFVFVFSFANKHWGAAHIDHISQVNYNKEAFNTIVLDPKIKQLVKASVEHHQAGFTDFIEGKGGGTIFLLHGKPGLGKTSLAEAVSETLQRPLYSISSGELGTTPEELEKKLRSVLSLVDRWNAVLLLDEADIFLEARNGPDVVRNSLVSIFLRLLEYHNGVLFLTTNRVKSIDTAFYSRIAIPLAFTDFPAGDRLNVWANLLQAAKIKDIEISSLVAHDLNGRQIKTVIRMAQIQARSQNRKPVLADFHQIIALQQDFQRHLTDAVELEAANAPGSASQKT